MPVRRFVLLFFLACLVFSDPALARRRARRTVMTCMATAHSEEGTTASGTTSRKGTVAADPDVIPLGSRIRVTGAGKYSGEYTVADTGRKIKGREIDIYMPTTAEAKEFGKKRVKVQIIQKGEAK